MSRWIERIGIGVAISVLVVAGVLCDLQKQAAPTPQIITWEERAYWPPYEAPVVELIGLPETCFDLRVALDVFSMEGMRATALGELVICATDLHISSTYFPSLESGGDIVVRPWDGPSSQ